jgi:hypothetical protein
MANQDREPNAAVGVRLAAVDEVMELIAIGDALGLELPVEELLQHCNTPAPPVSRHTGLNDAPGRI